MAVLYPKAIIVGGIVDVGLSMLLGFPFTAYVSSSRGLGEVPPEQMTTALMEAINSSIGLTVSQLAIGFSCSLLGGYVAAAIAKSDELLNGALASWLCIVIGVYVFLSVALGGLVWLHALTVVLSPLVYLGGAYLWLRRNRPLMFATDTTRERERERLG